MKPRKLIILGIGLLCGVLICEWSWGISLPKNYYIIFSVIAFMLILYGGVYIGAFDIRRYRSSGLVGIQISLLWIVLGIILEQLQLPESPYHVPIAKSVNTIYFGLVIAAISATIGFYIGQHRNVTQFILQRLAIIIAILSVYWYMFPLQRGMSEVFPSIYVGFPVRLFSMFALCWFFYEWIQQPRYLTRALVGIAASSLPTLVMLHKPIIFSTIVSLLVILCMLIAAKSERMAIIRKTFLLITVVAGLLFVVNLAKHGTLTANIISIIYVKYLHRDVGYTFNNQVELILAASGGRDEIWQAMWPRFYASPLFGNGFGQLDEKYGIPVHNGYFDLLISLGIFGTLPFLYIGFWWINYTMKPVLKRPELHFLIPLIAFLFGIAAYNLGGNSRVFLYLSAFAMFLVGLSSGHVFAEVRACVAARMGSGLKFLPSMALWYHHADVCQRDSKAANE